MENLIHLTDLSRLPLSSNQKRLWIIYQQDKLNPVYNLTLTYQLNEKINLEVFRESLIELFNRQHTVFSVFKQYDSIPYIEIIKKPVNVETIDFSKFPVSERRQSMLKFAGEDSRKYIDIEKGPLYRMYILKGDEKNIIFHLTIHHIIFDGWSTRIFVRDLSRIYTDMNRGIKTNLEPLVYQSYDFSASEVKTESREDDKELIEFWKENLKDCPAELKFPYEFPRKSIPSGFGYREPLSISAESTRRLKELCDKANTSLFKTFIGILGVLFQKYTGDKDICIGFPVSTRREHPFSESIFGLFVNTSLVRLKIDEDNNLTELINYTRDAATKAIGNSKLSFDRIVEAVNPSRRSNYNPLFQIALSWWNNVTVPMELDNQSCERINIPNGVSPVDITFYLWEESGQIKGELECNIDLIKIDTILRLKDNFIELVDNLANNPETPVKFIRAVTKEEIATLLNFTNTKNKYPDDKTIVALFEEQVKLFPERTALVFKDKSLTYKQLNIKKNQLAYNLINLGVGRNTAVGILADKSLDTIAGILSILKAGGAYVPIDPEYPQQRINFIIKDSGCKVLITQDKYLKTDIAGVEKISLDSVEIFNGNQPDFENTNSSSDLAYIIYTSGTTGIPKGVCIPQKGVVRLVRNTNFIELSSDDRILLAGAIVFDATTFDIWGALLNGGTLYIAGKETILDPKALGEELINNDITVLALTSSLFNHIAESRTDIFNKLKYLFVGGDVLSAHHINMVRKANPRLTVINAYGPTENSCMSTYYKIERDFENNIPIGKPISNSTAYIFDKNMNYQPIGVIGEIWVGGDGLSTGYLNREDLNRNSFADNPNNPGERLYRTGDFARWLPDGNIEFHGRIDNQLKLRGFRVELEEIESIISSIDGIIETVIKPFKVEEGDYKLVAFLNIGETIKYDKKKISDYLKTRLPSYMIPSIYKFMKCFPKTINGKTDRNSLNFDYNDIVIRESQTSKTLSHNERKILDIWCDVLKTKNISVTDNFFEIGGNSLLAISIMSKIKSAFNIDIGLRVFFDSPKVKDLAEVLDVGVLSLVGDSVKNNINEVDLKIVNGEI